MANNIQFSISSHNVRGINHIQKRTAIFNWVKSKEFDVVFLQETYSCKQDEQLWQSEWEGPMFFSHGSKHSCGTTIMVKRGFDFIAEEIDCDCNGRFILIKAKIQGEIMYLLNIYAPNSEKDKTSFFRGINLKLVEHNVTANDLIFIGGDWNSAMCGEMDKNGGRKLTGQTISDDMKTLITNFDLIDIWRVQNPTTKRYTFRQKRPLIQTRLDYFLISKYASDMVNQSRILASFCSDHSCVSLNLSTIEKSNKGNGLWKYNSSLNSDNTYVEAMKLLLNEWNNQYDGIENKHLKWDLIKYEIRNYTRKYGSKRKKDLNQEIVYLNNELTQLEIDLGLTPSEELQTEYETKRERLKEIEEERAKGAIIRSRVKWLEEGEKPTKYFFNLEKSNYSKKHIRKLHLENGQSVTNDKEILNEACIFYSDLYKSNNTIIENNNQFFTKDHKTLSNSEKLHCDNDITPEECYKCLLSFKNNKTPGNDGLTKEFYLKFWPNISKPLMESFRYSQEIGKMSTSQRQAVVTLIEKKDSDRQYLSNWRPISLLNFDYKLLTKTLANRIKVVLPSIISSSQTGYIKDRSITDSVRLIQDLLHYLQIKKLPGILLMIDFKKAFDSLEWNFITRALTHFNFGPNFIQWTQIIYNDISSCIINNNVTSQYFKIERGVRQGDPLSPYLFIISVELLAISLKMNSNINGINIDSREYKLTMYADDLTLTLSNTSSVHETRETLTNFGKCSGLEINKQKTEAMLIGSWDGYEEIPKLNVKITNKPVKLLGIYITADINSIVMQNFDSKIDALLRQLHWWKARDLSLKGKVLIVKSLGLSKFQYVASLLPIPETVIKRVNKIIYEFIWGGKVDKVKRCIFEQDYPRGGYKMLNFIDMIKSSSAYWMKSYLDCTDRDWKLTFESLCKIKNLNLFLRSNFDTKEIPASLPEYYVDSIKNWHHILQYKENNTNASLANFNFIWYNKDIKIEGNTVYCANLFSIGLWTIKDLYNTDDTIIPFSIWRRRGAKEIHRLLWMSIIRIANTSLKHLIKTSTLHTKVTIKSQSVSIQTITQKHIKSILANVKYESINGSSLKYRIKWSENFGIIANEHWENIFKILHFSPIGNKTKDLQYKIILRVISTNYLLYKMGKVTSPNCSFCHIALERIDHLFFECIHVKSLWASVFATVQQKFGTDLIPTLKLCILGYYDNVDNCSDITFSAINIIIVYVKLFIFRCKLEGRKPLNTRLAISLKSKFDFLRKIYSNDDEIFRALCNTFN